jgi:hypothetical protein
VKLKPPPASNAGDSIAILILACARKKLLQAFIMPGRAVRLAHYPLETTQPWKTVSCKPVFILWSQTFWIVKALWFLNLFTTFRRNVSPSSFFKVTHDQEDEGSYFFETSGIVTFKWPKYVDKNSRFLDFG